MEHVRSLFKRHRWQNLAFAFTPGNQRMSCRAIFFQRERERERGETLGTMARMRKTWPDSNQKHLSSIRNKLGLRDIWRSFAVVAGWRSTGISSRASPIRSCHRRLMVEEDAPMVFGRPPARAGGKKKAGAQAGRFAKKGKGG